MHGAIVKVKMSCNDRSENRTFRARENTALGALEQRLVELGGENSFGDSAQVVVRLHVFLDGLTAVVNKQQSAKVTGKLRTKPAGTRQLAATTMRLTLTWNHFYP